MGGGGGTINIYIYGCKYIHMCGVVYSILHTYAGAIN